MTNKYVQLIGVSAVLMMALIAAIVGANLRAVSAQESERDCVAEYRAIEARIRAAVEDGQVTEEQARARLVAFRQELGRSCNSSDNDGERGERRGDERRAAERRKLDPIANLIGIDARTLWGELKEGKSIAEVAQANGVDPQTIIDALVAEVQAEIDEALAAGRISPEEAAEKSAGIAERITYYVNETAKVLKNDGKRGEDERRELESIANLIGIDLRTLWGELKAGKSIAEVAQANGVDPQTIIDALVAEVQTGIDAKVATGDISAEEAAEWSAGIEQRITNYVNGTSEK